MTRYRPTPPEPGHRPRCRFAAGVCHCGTAFTLDRTVQPWARARTCSEACARKAGHQHRQPLNLHRSMVDEYRLTRDSQIQQREVAAADEDLVPVVFHDWLRTYQWQDAA